MSTKSTRSAGTQFTTRGVVQGQVLVCPESGLPVDCVVDQFGTHRLAVDAALSVSNVSVEVDLDGLEDSVHIIDPTDGDVLLINADGSIDANVEVDSSDGDNIAISAHPSPIYDKNADTVNSLAAKIIYTYISTDNRTRIIRLDCSCGTSSLYSLKINGIVEKVQRSSPMHRDVIFKFDEHRRLLSGDTLTVEIEIDQKFKPSFDTFVSLEGYLI